MADIEELADRAHHLKVMWRKANNYYTSFAREFLEAKQIVDQADYGKASDSGLEWTFSRWLLRKCGMLEDQVIAQLKNHMLILAQDDRDKVREEAERLERERRAAKARVAAEKRAAAAERRAIAAHEKRVREEERARRQAQAEEDRRQREETRRAAQEEEAAAKNDAAAKKTRRDNSARAKQRREAKKQQLSATGPQDADLQRLLAKCATIEKTSRLELGECYVEMRDLVQMKRAGKDEDGKDFTWVKFVHTYISRSRADIWKCIQEYEDFVASCNNSQNANVIGFPKKEEPYQAHSA